MLSVLAVSAASKSPWFFLLTPPFDGAMNMAFDEAMLSVARERKVRVARVYSWAQTTVSFGRNQAVAGVYDNSLGEELNVAFVRRLTGGRALVHGREITYSVALPAAQDVRPRALYAQINQTLLAAFQLLGVQAAMTSDATPTPSPAAGICFSEPSAGEVTFRGKKLAGSAQVRLGGALLQHGSVIVEDNQDLLRELARGEVPAPPPAASLSDALGRHVEPSEFAAALRTALSSVWSTEVRDLDSPRDLERAARDLRARYASQDWTWRGIS